jgi:nitrate reductase alpha subunit
MIVTMARVREVQVAIDEIADMVAMRHGLVSASRSVHMAFVVTGTGVARRAMRGIRRAHFDHMLVHVTIVHMMQMTVVQVVDVIAMANGGVAAAGPVNVRVVCMLGAGALAHGLPSWHSGRMRFGRC